MTASSGAINISVETNKGVLVLIEPDSNVRDAFLILLQAQGWAVEAADDADSLERLLGRKDVTAVISEASLPSGSAAEVLRACSQRRVPVVFTGHGLATQAAVDLIQQGASDYLEKPFPHIRLLDLLNQLTNRHNT